MIEQMRSNWYALYVRSRHEKSVHNQLDAKAEETLLPLYLKRNKWADRWKIVSLPLFPGYVFCRFDAARRASVLATSGVIDVVRAGSAPAPVEDSEIEAIRRLMKSSLPAEPYEELVQGESVTMTEGPLKGLSGTLIEIRAGYRLVLSVELLQRSVAVEIDRGWVVANKRPPLFCFDSSAPPLSKVV